MRQLIIAVTLMLPWPVRRILLNSLLGFQIHRTSRIGFAWVLPRRLIMEKYSHIGHLTVCKGLDLLHLKEFSGIGRLNWVTGYPTVGNRLFMDTDRRSELIIGIHASITHRHLIDCTSSITIGDFSTIAGWRSQIMTHSIDLLSSRQASRPIRIGRFCLVGTDCVILGGSELPDYAVLGAKSLLNKVFTDSYWLYAGTPSRAVKALPEETMYFHRSTGFVS